MGGTVHAGAAGPGTGDNRPGGDLAAFVGDLRELRAGAGAPSYATLARRTGVPRSTLHDALRGDRFPSQETVVALVGALGGDVSAWRQRWAAVRLATDEAPPAPETDRISPPTDADHPPAREESAAPDQTARRWTRRRWVVLAAVVVVLAGAGVLTWSLTRGGCVPGERYVMSAAGDLLDAHGGVLEKLDTGETVVVVDKHPPEYRSRYRAVSDHSGDTGYVDESKIDPVGDACT